MSIAIQRYSVFFPVSFSFNYGVSQCDACGFRIFLMPHLNNALIRTEVGVVNIFFPESFTIKYAAGLSGPY